MNWNPSTKPTPANIRKRITAAEEAAIAARTLIAKNERLSKKGGPDVPLDNALAWLADAFHKTR